MANSEHLAKLKEGVEAWNKWRKEHPEVAPDLSDANPEASNPLYAAMQSPNPTDDVAEMLERAAEFSHAARALQGANLAEAKLDRANLSMADLCGARLENANLSEANLHEANLAEADLTEANLTRSNLSWANLTKTNLTKATLAFTTFGNNDLSTTDGLGTVRHRAPSTIGIDTIYRSQGKIPLAFLRGAGVPENFIEYMSSLTGKALEFYSCFISYSTKNEDQEFADRLHADLQNKGVRCWFAPHDIQAGKKIHEQIDVGDTNARKAAPDPVAQ